ncbi:hypothetical protein ABIA96_000449 [Bradyrhizobium sp. LB11.1]
MAEGFRILSRRHVRADEWARAFADAGRAGCVLSEG